VIFVPKGKSVEHFRNLDEAIVNITQAERHSVSMPTLFLQSIYCYYVDVCLWKVVILKTGIMMYPLYNIKKAEGIKCRDLILYSMGRQK